MLNILQVVCFGTYVSLERFIYTLAAYHRQYNLGQRPYYRLLQSRFKRNQPYTRLGYSTLIVVNPYQPLEILNDVTLNTYADIGYRNIVENKPFMQPHVYDLAARVYFHMRRTGEDQSIILR